MASTSNNTNEPSVPPADQHTHDSKEKKTELGSKRRRSNSLEAAAQLTQLDGPSLQKPSPPQSTGGYQPTLGPPHQIHPSQYANAFSAGQSPVSQQRFQASAQQEQQTQQHAPDVSYSGSAVAQSPAFRPNTGGLNQAFLPVAPAAGVRTHGIHQTRQRTAVACRYCRKRKIRCTGISNDLSETNDPRCSNCRRLNQQCVYAPVGAPQGTFPRQLAPDQYGRGQEFHPMPQPGMQQGPPWQGYIQVAPYPPPGQGRGMPGHNGQAHYLHPPGQYPPPPGYPPQAQQYQYYTTYVNEPNVAGGAQAEFGRLKPETYAVFSSAAEPQAAVLQVPVQNSASTDKAVPSAPNADMESHPSMGPSTATQESQTTSSNGVQKDSMTNRKYSISTSAQTDGTTHINGATDEPNAPANSVAPAKTDKTTSPRVSAGDGMLSTLLNPQTGQAGSDPPEENSAAEK